MHLSEALQKCINDNQKIKKRDWSSDFYLKVTDNGESLKFFNSDRVIKFNNIIHFDWDVDTWELYEERELPIN